MRKNIKIGIIGLSHNCNIGNNLLKYAISVKLTQLGYTPYIIGKYDYAKHQDIHFIKHHTNLIIIDRFSEIKRNDYDILMVNSDQTWRKFYSNFYNIAFLYFARNWNILKFIYGASLGFKDWKFNKKDELIAKDCLKSFKGISVREIGAVERIKKHLNITPTFVLDPTFLIDKKYYLDIINNFVVDKYIGEDFLFTYIFTENKNITKFIQKASESYNYKIFRVKKYNKNAIQKFIYGLYNCKAAITDSYHGTLFSIIFNKPFVAFINKNEANDRFDSLIKTFKINDRVYDINESPNINLLLNKLQIDRKIIKSLKTKSIHFLISSLKEFKK